MYNVRLLVLCHITCNVIELNLPTIIIIYLPTVIIIYLAAMTYNQVQSFRINYLFEPLPVEDEAK